MPFKIMNPDGTQTPVPQRLEPFFAYLDQTGRYSLTQNNGRYDFLDASVSRVRNMVKKYAQSELGGRLNPDEIRFLRKKSASIPIEVIRSIPTWPKNGLIGGP